MRWFEIVRKLPRFFVFGNSEAYWAFVDAASVRTTSSLPRVSKPCLLRALENRPLTFLLVKEGRRRR